MALKAPNRLVVVEDIARQYPTAFANAHRDGQTRFKREEFVRRVARRLWEVDGEFGLNGKRGNENDLSQDAISYRNPASAAGGVEIIDIVSNSKDDPGKPPRAPAWFDVTQETIDKGEIGKWVKPRPVDAPDPPPPPTGHGILARLDRLESATGNEALLEARVRQIEEMIHG